jgi:hypothetical protein
MLKLVITAKKHLFAIAVTVIFISLCVGVSAEQPLAYHGNTKSKIFHKESCRYYNCKRCTTDFTIRRQAIEAGYRPCKICKP